MILRWGILGLGKIANKFAQDLELVENNTLMGVASRSEDRAIHFANQYSVPYTFSSYRALLESDQIDIVYIATPHHLHAQLSIDALDHGKHVLCEKPSTVNSEELRSVVHLSKMKSLFFMEALWTRFNPNIIELYNLLQKGDLGEIRFINAPFCFNAKYDSESRLFNPRLAGGALLDIGIYPVFLAYLCLGMPIRIHAIATFTDEGVDKSCTITLEYTNAVAQLYCSLEHRIEMEATVGGDKGSVNLESRWHETEKLNIKTSEGLQKIYNPQIGNGFTGEIEESYKCVLQKKYESSIWSHQDSLHLLKILDQIREIINLKYPFEKL